MTVEFLIQAIVHQTTILIAQLATLGGGRAPLAQVANQVFLDLVREIERQGVSRKVSADMFGLGLRTYRRKIQRLTESSTDRGRSLWEVVLEYINSRERTTKGELLVRFSLDDETQVRAVLHDLCESGLVVSATEGTNPTYRARPDEELDELRHARGTDGLEDLLVAVMYREGPLTLHQIAARAQVEVRRIETSIQRLAASGRIREHSTEHGQTSYEARSLVIPLGASAGWEAAVLDHYKAMVKTILARLGNQSSTSIDDSSGGSTYTIDIWPGHPMEAEVRGALKQVRSTLSDLRERVSDYSNAQQKPERYSRVVFYTGQSTIEEDGDDPINLATTDEHQSDEEPRRLD